MVRKLPWRDRSSCSPTRDAKEPNGNKRRKITPTPQLCAHCRLLDLDKSFQQAYEFYKSAREGLVPRRQDLCGEPDDPLYYEDGFLVHYFQDRLTTWLDCPLCRFFRSMRVQPGLHRNYKLLAFCSSESSLFCLPRLKISSAWDKVSHTVFMAVVPDVASIPPHGHEEHWLEKDIPAVGSIYRLRPGDSEDVNTILHARELDEKVDFSVIREWLSFCDKYHDGLCKRGMLHTSISRGFRVINCDKDPPVVEDQPWGITYAALSYVWGKGPIEQWPKTVLDAVAVTKEMGLQYLWVDRLCIDQTNPAEKHYLISAMATIYSEAKFTIVAAAGSGASHGLPGVRSTPRKPQPKFKLENGSVLVSTLQDPRREILESEWCTRGWTYQEGILSNRRLVFTDHQAYWECRCMAIHDNICLPLHLVHEPSGTHMADFMLAGIFKGDSYSGGVPSDDSEELVIADDSYRLDYGFPIHDDGSIRIKLRGLEEHIRAFSARNLSYDEDSLTAFQGITGLYGPNDMIHPFLGIPMWIGQIAGGRPGAQITFALSVCSWYHRSDSSLQMFVSELCRRRTHLPSWTWAGWKGTVSWRAPPMEEHSVIMCSLIEIDELDLLWAADIYLRNASRSASIRLADVDSAQDLRSDVLRLLEVREPLTLNYFNCKMTEKKWMWRRLAGRQGREKYDAGSMDWDSQWRRLAGKLVSISVSISMTADEWTEKHWSKELISVLMFAGRIPSIGHGRARFLTLRKVQSPDMAPRWERIGTVQLQISDGELSKYRTNEEFLKGLPVQRGGELLVIQ